MRIPAATYRVQLSPDFGFRDATGILDHLASLGISHFYAGPIFKARPGSKHGYDIVDSNSLNPELGSEADFRNLMMEIKRRGIGWIQDIVPNHMAIDSSNAVLMDVLESFTDSEFYDYFDIDWQYHPNTMEAKVIIPFLDRPYRECMARAEIHLNLDPRGVAFVYKDLRLPLRLTTYPDLLESPVAAPEATPPETGRLARLFRELPKGPDRPAKVALAKAELRGLYDSDTRVRAWFDRTISAANSSAGDLSGAGFLHSLLEKQVFKLVQWRTGSAEINYRRFFNVSRLISLRMEDPSVFEHYHRLLGKWLADGFVDGVRVDHIDGLYDAQSYLSKLRTLAPDAYVVAEKVLGPDETLSPHWEIQGTTGYDFLNNLNGVFCMQSNAGAFESLYRGFTGSTQSYDDLVYENKRMIIETHFESAVRKLAHMAEALCADMSEITCPRREALKQGLRELIASFPVYRTYMGPRPPHPADRRRVEEASEDARDRNPEVGTALAVLETLILTAATDLEDSDLARRRLRFVRTLQQYTGPVMAKGFEDTVLYVYNRLLSLNEVGGEPQEFGVSLEEFHNFNQKRLAEWPHSMSATSTQDTKRGEDIRARLNVLSEIPGEFGQRTRRWTELNSAHAGMLERTRVPTPSDEYFLYQTLVGAYPFEERDRAGFLVRLEAYMIKAIREGKTLTTWADPDIAYETGLIDFVRAIMNPEVSPEFLEDFMDFAGKVHRYGVFNSLSQTLIKIAAPGVPDFYQGSELWDLNLVDPDNRRPVAFKHRIRLLSIIAERSRDDLHGLLRDLLSHPEDGSVKLFLVHRALKVRNGMIDLFSRGAYMPLCAEGRMKQHVIAFARRYEDRIALALAPRFFTVLIEPQGMPVGSEVWGDTAVVLPEDFPKRWRDEITGRDIHADHGLKVADVLTDFPVALLTVC
jgi:(1->4)-alpha-D-glucan 1-alpha-D-glucosylmutase